MIVETWTPLAQFVHMDTNFQISRRVFLAAVGSFAATLAPSRAANAAETPLTAFKPQGSGGFDHSAFSAVLKGVVQPDAHGYNRVAYRALKSKSAALKDYLSSLQAISPSTLSTSEAKAFWINLYNAKTLDVVIDRYPVASIKKVNLGGGGLFGSGPWSAKILAIEGQDLSLDDIEHSILFPLFKDKMLHYALNCASYSCPNLAARAYTGDNAAAQMQENATAYINHPRGVSIDGGVITASKIYSWYQSGFGGKAQLKPHWTKFAAPQAAAEIASAEIGGFAYDWRLNDV